MPETFSSEIGDVHERRGDRPSFTDEFNGASESLIDRDRPPRPIEVGRRGRRLMFGLIIGIAVLVGGGWALWYWSEWIASWNADDEPAPSSVETAKSEPALVEPTPVEPEPTKVFGVKGAPEGSDAGSETPPVVAPPVTPPTKGEPLPVEPLDTPPSPATKPAAVVVASTSVRGKVSSARVGSKLAAIDSALKGCWASAVAKPETKRPATLSLSFGIKWNGHLISSSVGGDAPDAVENCVREALPSGGWPQPRDGGEGHVTRTWTLE